MGSLLLFHGSWCAQGSVYALQESVSPVVCKFWWLCGWVNGDLLQVSLCHTQVYCTQSPCPRSPLLTRTSSGGQTPFCLSLSGFFFGGVDHSGRGWSWSQVTADGDCSHEIERYLLLGRKAMTNLDSILKIRDITLPTKLCLVKAMVFPVVMHGCESWTIKKAEHQRIDAFELWCWRKLLRVPWTARRSNQFILKEISPEYPLKGLMLKLKLQYLGHLM